MQSAGCSSTFPFVISLPIIKVEKPPSFLKLLLYMPELIKFGGHVYLALYTRINTTGLLKRLE